MQLAYLQAILFLHAGFAAVFFFLNRRRPTRFARLFGWSWAIESARAAILLPGIRQVGPDPEYWYCASDVLSFFANWCLVAGAADTAGVKLPRWLAPAYYSTGIPLVIFNRFALPSLLHRFTGVSLEQGGFDGVLANMVLIFVPVGIARVTVVVWLLKVWRRTHLAGALVATWFSVPYAVVALAVPLQFLFSYNPDWMTALWFVRVLGFSIGLVMLFLDLQETAVAKSEASLAAAQALAKLGSWEQDMATGEGTWSAEMFRLYGRDPAQGVMSYADFLATIHPDDCETFRRNEALALAERRSSWHEFRIMRPDGSVRWIQGWNTPICDGAGEVVRLVGTEQDVTERKRTEAFVELQHAVTRELAQARLLEPTARKVLEMMAGGLGWDFGALWTVERTTKTLRCVETWQRSPEKFSEFAAETMKLVLGDGQGFPGRIASNRASMLIEETGIEQGFVRREIAMRDGLHAALGFPIMSRDEVLGVVELFHHSSRDPDAEMLTVLSGLGTQIAQFMARLRLEEQHRQSQKLEAVGTLAGGIAHDFNNILTAINGYTELAKLEAPSSGVLADHLNAVHLAARRATELVRQILAFSRRENQERTAIRLDEVVVEAIQLLRASIPSSIEIKCHCAPSVSPINADATSIHQVLVNLGTNAWHALKESNGVIEVTVEDFECSMGFTVTHPGLRAGQYVRLTMKDSGHGMEPAVMARIFEPFFTTKPPGEGTGLGLSVVHGIMHSHQGAIFVSSRPGEGTEFQLYFPAHTGLAAESGNDTSTVPIGRGQRVLYVDDEVPLARMGKEMLERLGYHAEFHSEPLNALKAFGDAPDSYDLLVTDLTMPGMTGIELARHVRNVRPSLPIVLMSGYTAALAPAQLKADGIRLFLQKPHSIDALGRGIHEALRGPENV